MHKNFTPTKIFFFLILALLILVPNVYGVVTPPNFPSCANPQGTVKASYPSGTHGIVGTATLYDGTDTVYSVSENIVMQCLCPVNGEGIQTNWWKIPQFSGEEIENFKTQGWIFVPDGKAWGLDPAAYLAKNINFSCKSSGGGSSSSSNGSSTGGTSSIGEILALASTGNIRIIYGLIFVGLLSMTVGHLLSRRNS